MIAKFVIQIVKILQRALIAQYIKNRKFATTK